MPRPTRRRAFLAPAAGLMVFSSMCFVPASGAQSTFTMYETLLIMPRTAGVSSSVDSLLRLAQAEAAHRRAMRLARAGDALAPA